MVRDEPACPGYSKKEGPAPDTAGPVLPVRRANRLEDRTLLSCGPVG